MGSSWFRQPFSWQGVGPIIDPPWQPTLIYPARGGELLWQPGRPVRKRSRE